MAKPTQFKDFVYFRYLATNPNYSFRTYTDAGIERGYLIGYNDKKQPIYKKWEFDNQTRYQIRVSNTEKDLSGQLAVDFLRDSPECAESRNGHYDGQTGVQYLVYFKEINEGKDAEVAIDKRRLVIEAQTKALALKGSDLDEMAALEGMFTQDEGVKMHRMLDFAANKPEEFIKRLNDPSRKVKALISRGIESSVLLKDGKMVKWEGKLIGADTEDAVANLLKDEKLLAAIKKNIENFGG